MTIWVDADSCPRQIREIILRAAVRRAVDTVFVANRKIPLPTHPRIRMVTVPKKEGAADRYIIEQSGTSDLVITRDIPLAAELVKKRRLVLNDRGIVYTSENVGQRLSERNFMLELHSMGLKPEKTSRFGKKEVQLFANAFDRELSRKLSEN